MSDAKLQERGHNRRGEVLCDDDTQLAAILVLSASLGLELVGCESRVRICHTVDLFFSSVFDGDDCTGSIRDCDTEAATKEAEHAVASPYLWSCERS